ncbi:MAG: hypothetical protein E2P02_21980 [Acidobacteria bacterium]|nr:MAG: hypothetical protein E2P02_21980 [Acidobacteriota bacterium]
MRHEQLDFPGVPHQWNALRALQNPLADWRRGYGEVYKSKDTRLDRTVAIKVLPEHLAESAERKERFEREAKAISQLNHPHICTLYDVEDVRAIEAFLWLDRAYSERAAMAVGLPTHLWVDPLRDDPRFQNLLRRMNFPE